MNAVNQVTSSGARLRFAGSPRLAGRGRAGARGRAVLAWITAATAFAGSCRTVPRPTIPVAPPEAPRAAATPTPAPLPSEAPRSSEITPNFGDGPVIRVGILVDVNRATVSAPGGVVLQTTDGRRTQLPRATFQRQNGTSATTSRLQVQVASLTDETAARVIAGQAGQIAGLPTTIQWTPETRTHKVRLTGVKTREHATEVITRLAQRGISGGFVVDEPVVAAGARIRLAETGEEMTVATLEAYRPDEVVTVDSLTYRGTVEVRGSDAGLTVINMLPIEDYLRGVVPNELSPSAFPEIEAIKAQAIAARTYALRNRGQFEARGYDICATPACQVYRGQSTELPLSDRAVEETRGISASHRGVMINALYTSTCGGHTEDSANIFDGPQLPYLKGVACEPEKSAWSTLRTGAPVRVTVGEEDVAAAAALLVALGVLDADGDAPTALRGDATEAQLREWPRRLVTALSRDTCEAAVPEEPLTRRGTFLRHLVGTLCWEERLRLLAPPDADYLLQVEDRAEIESDAERQAAALLVKEGVLAPFRDNTLRIGQPMTRGQAVLLLARVAERSAPPSLIGGTFRSASPTGITLDTEAGPQTWAVGPMARLYRSVEGMKLPTSELSLIAGDKVRVVLKDGRAGYVEAEQNRLGASADRTSKYYQWEVRLTPEQVAEQASRFGEVGRVRDVQPRRTGVSGRVVDIAIVGSDGEMLLHGLKIRTALGLRENLFVIDRERDRSGGVARFIFTGKGWGHGVGMCQVGAFGMAQAGATYQSILRHYYGSAITLDKHY